MPSHRSNVTQPDSADTEAAQGNSNAAADLIGLNPKNTHVRAKKTNTKGCGKKPPGERYWRNRVFARALKAADAEYRIYQMAPAKQIQDADSWFAGATHGTCVAGGEQEDDATLVQVENANERLASTALAIFKAMEEAEVNQDQDSLGVEQLNVN